MVRDITVIEPRFFFKMIATVKLLEFFCCFFYIKYSLCGVAGSVRDVLLGYGWRLDVENLFPLFFFQFLFMVVACYALQCSIDTETNYKKSNGVD